jgi:hypothetical protein
MGKLAPKAAALASALEGRPSLPEEAGRLRVRGARLSRPSPSPSSIEGEEEQPQNWWASVESWRARVLAQPPEMTSATLSK